MGDVIGSLLASGVLQLEAIGNTILKAGSDDAEEGEDPLLIDSGKAAPIVAASLQQFAATAGPETAVAAWRSSRLQLDAFLPSVRPLFLPPCSSAFCLCWVYLGSPVLCVCAVRAGGQGSSIVSRRQI